MPPVSVTMQATNLPPAAAGLLEPPAGEPAGGLLDVPLEPHAAASIARALSAATVLNLPLTVTSSAGGGLRPPGRTAGAYCCPAGWGSGYPGGPPRDARRLAPGPPGREALMHCPDRAGAESRPLES